MYKLLTYELNMLKIPTALSELINWFAFINIQLQQADSLSPQGAVLHD